EKEVGAYLDAQLQRAEALSTDLESRLRKMLSAGTFVFRSTPESVASHGENVNDAAGAQLKEVVGKVFSKYALAPIQAEGALAERFLKTPSLQQVASLNDPLGLVTTSAGQKRIDVDRPALLAIKDYLQKRGQVDGGRLLDDFYAPEFGWSKDTTRYLVAALLVAGVVKLRVSGSDVTVRGDIAIESLRNNNNFKKAGVALRDSIISPQAKLRAAQRVLDLTGDQVMPVEQEISQAVLRHFPEMQRSYASIPSQLKAAGLPGEQRAVDLQSALTGVLAADASDATPKLGSDPCPLMNDLIWARDVRLAFDNGLDQTVAELRRHVRDIADLPLVGVLRDLIASTVETRESATNHLARDDFYRHIPAIQTLLKQLKVAAEDGCRHLATEKERELAKLVSEIESMPEWLMLGGEFQEQFSSRLDALAITVEPGLDGIRKLLNQSLVAAGELAQIRLEITEIVAAQKEMPPVPPEPGGETGAATEVEIALPTEISSLAEIEQLLSALESVRARLAGGERIAIRWK
ncbi:MAG TPA: hypothetical protein VMM36_17295, partial [Opitutaceae bacterium]|nr:hypothetical protein [Opitutaceae bacterium]